MNTPETQDGSQGCLVIIDDIPENLILLTRTLTQHGYKIRAATTGAMGLETIRAEPPDLVLLDLMLPDLDGYEVCRQLKQDPTCATIPVIFLTARNKTDDVVHAFEAGCAARIMIAPASSAAFTKPSASNPWFWLPPAFRMISTIS
jgi:CheY-like chemotaxis protein